MVIVSVIALGFLLSACESNKLLDVGSLWSPSKEKPVKVAGAEGAPNATVDGEKVVNADGSPLAINEENVVLGGPEDTATVRTARNENYPSLANQPNKPTKLMSRGQKTREIAEMKKTGQGHVETRSAELNEDAFEPKDIKPNKIPVKKAKSSIFGLDWLKSAGPGKKSTVAKNTADSLTPPQKLRLARSRAKSPVATSDVVMSSPSLAATPIVATAPVTAKKASRVARRTSTSPKVMRKSAPVKVASIPRRSNNSTPGSRPTLSRPQRIFFSSGARKLSASQQRPLDDLARLRNGSSDNVYVLGFAAVSANAGKRNIDSQNLAIARANHVATGLRSRGFRGDQIVVQVIDQTVKKGRTTGAALRRVEVYFEGQPTLRR